MSVLAVGLATEENTTSEDLPAAWSEMPTEIDQVYLHETTALLPPIEGDRSSRDLDVDFIDGLGRGHLSSIRWIIAPKCLAAWVSYSCHFAPSSALQLGVSGSVFGQLIVPD